MTKQRVTITEQVVTMTEPRDNDKAGSRWCGVTMREQRDNDRAGGDNDRACSGGGGGVSEVTEWDRGWKEDYNSHHCQKTHTYS